MNKIFKNQPNLINNNKKKNNNNKKYQNLEVKKYKEWKKNLYI